VPYLVGVLDLFFSETLIVLTDGFNDMEVIVLRSRGHRRRSVIRGSGGDVGRCDQEMGCFRLGTEIEGMETFGGRFELNETLGCVNFEHPPMIMAIICDMVFLAKQEE
jgi:hypothetical protein